MPKLKERRSTFGQGNTGQRLSAAFHALSILGYDSRGESADGRRRAASGDNLELGVRSAALNLIRNVINGETFDDIYEEELGGEEQDS